MIMGKKGSPPLHIYVYVCMSECIERRIRILCHGAHNITPPPIPLPPHSSSPQQLLLLPPHNRVLCTAPRHPWPLRTLDPAPPRTAQQNFGFSQ